MTATDPKLANYTDKQIKALVENHRRKGATDLPTYVSALKEQARRSGRGLNFDRSVTVIWEAAKQQRFLSYKELADASGVEWNRVHYAIGSHLWQLIEYAYRKGWPLLSAVVVNKQNVETGRMEPETLRGFAAAAEQLGYIFDSAEGFLAEQQDQVFSWALSIDRNELLDHLKDHW